MISTGRRGRVGANKAKRQRENGTNKCRGQGKGSQSGVETK